MATTTVFPARAGMSRLALSRVLTCPSVPRASGDEPRAQTWSEVWLQCSPRERG